MEVTRIEIGAAAKDFWCNRLEMAEPKYCANGSWGYFRDGFTFGSEWAINKLGEPYSSDDFPYPDLSYSGYAADKSKIHLQSEKIKELEDVIFELGMGCIFADSVWLKYEHLFRSIRKERLNSTIG